MNRFLVCLHPLEPLFALEVGSAAVTIDGTTEATPCRPLTAADMQGAKSTYGMLECSHSVWCKCQRGNSGPHFKFATRPMETYQEMIDWIEKEVGCEMKTYDELCSWAHYSPGVAKGGAFTEFECSCCGYKPSEQRWRADLAAWHELSDEERRQRELIHRDDGREYGWSVIGPCNYRAVITL